ncbi:photosystem II 22 kDa protein, chloroplastic [Syzygium oleosum]|uniref:photosystem II 22 kDa protein, chloroplastic n=1 Tax=Syzygium oleosum TaxID=219896 RepID=UPI0011D2BFC2|nr:photosystem II 22 kDa protein, chloroplastic [Syzygium oleosum]
MAQTMMLMPSVSGHSVDLKRPDRLLQFQIQRLRPNSSSFSQNLLFSPLPPPAASHRSSAVFALFKSKTKAPPKRVEKAKPKVEDGIFGTSGGIGFTKENELFVGRVAMIGFAASLLGEAITGKGILAQLNLETGVPIYEAEPLLLFFILFTLLGAIGALGDRGRFVDDPPTGIDGAVIPPGKSFRSALGLKEGGPLFGFTKANELFVGRLAQLGFAFSLIGEIITGKGALAQLNIETGVPISEIEPLVLFNVLFFFIAALNPGTGKFLTDEDIED